MRLARLVLLPVASLVLAACGSAAVPSWTPPTVTTAPSGPVAPAASGSPAASPAAVTPSPLASSPATAGAGTRIEIRLTDALKMEPASVTVRAGVPVTFVVTNTGALDHEFYVGDEQAQQTEDQAMGGATTAPSDSPNRLGLRPGETKELTITFRTPGPLLAGCHVDAHYLAGMKATITVQ